MPVIKSAKKKLRQDKKRTLANTIVEEAMKKAIKAARKNPSIKTLSLAFKTTDKAVKKYVIHKNKAARIKSNLSKLLSPHSTGSPQRSSGQAVQAKSATSTPKAKTKSAHSTGSGSAAKKSTSKSTKKTAKK